MCLCLLTGRMVPVVKEEKRATEDGSYPYEGHA
jgi:hypothetical protein